MQLAFNQFDSSPSEDRQTILILHGLFGSKRNWQSIARQLSEQCQVFTLDLRNHGESGHHDNMTYQVMADDVFQFISERSLKNVSVIGHSMGGKVAMQMALQHPEIIKRLVIIDIAPVKYEHGFNDLIDSLRALPLDQISSRQEADEHLRSTVQPETLRQFLLQNLKKSADGFHWRINLDAIQANIDALMDFPNDHRVMQYQNSVLFLKGEKSDYIKHLYEQNIFKIFSRALFITVADTGHWLHAENPDFVVQEIRKFIK
jgi:pimeloyl-ACP methyl ester carboxylesterase